MPKRLHVFLLCLLSSSFFSMNVLTAQEPAQTSLPQASALPVVDRLGDEASQALYKLYDYDRSIPLEARTVERIEQEGHRREKIVFRSTQGYLVPGYLQFPKSGKTPYPIVLLLHGWSGSKDHWWKDDGYISGGNVRRALLNEGYAILALDAHCHGDRISLNDFAPVNHFVDTDLGSAQRKGYYTITEIYMQTTRDYRRAIDYLETRTDLDSSRLGMIGYSMGGAQTFFLTGVEPRIKASVSCCAPAEKNKWSPIAPQNYLAGIGERPFLMIMGRTDEMCPVGHAQGLYAQIPATTKELLFVDAGHKLPPTYVPHAIDWIKQHVK